VFGPTELAARMEGSKAFSKDFMIRHSIPTAKFQVFTAAEIDKAIQHVKTCGYKVVLKASGLAAGKGVLLPETVEEAVQGLREIMVHKAFDAAGWQCHCCACMKSLNDFHHMLGDEVVIEECLTGPEISVFAISDGYTIVPFPAAQDHKRIGDGDIGPNTGGMGAYVPAPVATPAIMDQIMKESLRPTIDGMRREGKCESFLHHVH
jgi:phosphoribosylamine--glycine ligase / phosphoribosylformylglycinamidine cyclo-ligase